MKNKFSDYLNATIVSGTIFSKFSDNIMIAKNSHANCWFNTIITKINYDASILTL